MPLTMENVTYTYQPGGAFQATAIHDVSLHIADGELLALIGHTGSGKSTLAQHLNGLLKPASGRVLLDGQDINLKETDKRDLRFQVGLVFQYPEYQLFEETVEKDIGFGPRNMGLSKDEVDARVRRAMDSVGLVFEEVGQKSPFELSGGQMRRVALAGVLAMTPRILVLDEPTAGLDPRARAYLLKDIQHLHEEGTTVVMISHSMDDVAQLATRIAVLEQGRLVTTGTPEEIFEQFDRLTQMGLDVPQASKLSHLLRDKGVAIPLNYQLEPLADALEQLLKGGACHAQ
ncbi:MAG: energy-coupling factor transporter ATPase [Eubacteriales bacterium]|jgi:energy-coupling factor transport system ATP-binding protein|nr:energy-coupling factor transporter ATPase [Eubacteriales bacterium]MDD4104403.1 energy-coupling factor transporter ATPase [Eubacteriales bacterium]MDD4709650.1 energy-coupling factor transporter ATPase [Eubacteriales bacterium]NLO16381.1 energy-coupling factor transporter ATPase [Clostridiales bacterium]